MGFTNTEIYKGQNIEKPEVAVYDWGCGVLYKDDNGNFCLYHFDGIANPVSENSLGKWTGRKDKIDPITLVCQNDIISFKYRFRTYVGKIVRSTDGVFEVLYITADKERFKRVKLSKARGIVVIGNGYNNLSTEEMYKEVVLGQKIYAAKCAKLLQYDNKLYGYDCPHYFRRYRFCYNAFQEGKCNNCSSVYCYFNHRRVEGFND